MDIQSIQTVIVTALVGVIIGYARYVNNLKDRVSVLEKGIVDMKEKFADMKENIEKTIETIQKRLDSHSKKYDVILERIGSMEKEVLKETGTVRADIAGLKSDLEGFSRLWLASDNGIKISRQ